MLSVAFRKRSVCRNAILLCDFDSCAELRDRVVKTSLGFNHLIVVTTSQCLVYRCSNLTTPHIFDLKDAAGISVLLQSPKYFLMVDTVNGLQACCSSHICERLIDSCDLIFFKSILRPLLVF
jgi:hypothetical protein